MNCHSSQFEWKRRPVRFASFQWKINGSKRKKWQVYFSIYPGEQFCFGFLLKLLCVVCGCIKIVFTASESLKKKTSKKSKWDDYNPNFANFGDGESSRDMQESGEGKKTHYLSFDFYFSCSFLNVCFHVICWIKCFKWIS